MIETNPFRYFLPGHPRLLILGSFPCFNGVDYGDWFYSGSGKNHFWKLLSDIYAMPVANRAEKKVLCETHGIALADVAYKVSRRKGDCSDANLQILELNEKGIAACLDAGIKRVRFTSRFVEMHFQKMFPGANVRARLLPSPSPAANRHIGGLEEYLALKAAGTVSSPYEYRLRAWRRMLR